MSKYIDIGVNITSKQLAGSVFNVLEDGHAHNVTEMIFIGSTLKCSLKSLEVAEIHNLLSINKVKLWATIGVHPHDAKEWTLATYDAIDLQLTKNNNTIVAVGETGLDYDRMFSTKEEQLKAFEDQIKLSIKYNKPLFLHERDAFDDFYKMLEKYQGQIRGVVHCFTGTRANVQKYISLGMYIGITGWIGDNRRNADLLEAVKYIPLDKIMLETDAPYLSPIRNKVCYPSEIRFVCQLVAKQLKIQEDEFARICYNNTRKFFSI